MDLFVKDKYILHGAADSIREHNRIHQRIERNAVFITAHLDFAADLIDLLADDKIAAVKHGQWVTHSGCGLLKCSCCGYEYSDHIECTNFCGNCGAKMDKEE